MIDNLAMKLIPNRYHTKFVGNPDCRYITTYLMYLIDVAAAYTSCAFTDLADHKLYIGPGQPFTGVCPGHTAHTGFAVDVNYFTTNEKPNEAPNCTQWTEEGRNLTQIWNGSEMLENKFHWAANFFFFRTLQEFGITQYRTSEIIRQKYIEKGFDQYGMEGMRGDFEFNYKHHTHAHIEWKPDQVIKSSEYWDNKRDYQIIEVDKRLNNEILPVNLFITPDDPVIVDDLNQNNLMVGNPTNCDYRVVEIYRQAQKDFNYISDTGDYWRFPWELRQAAGSDCEDYSNNLASYYIAAGIPYWRIAVCTGLTNNNQGHATVYYLKDNLKEWALTDSTSKPPSYAQTINNPAFPVIGTTEHANYAHGLKTFDRCYNNKKAWWGFEI